MLVLYTAQLASSRLAGRSPIVSEGPLSVYLSQALHLQLILENHVMALVPPGGSCLGYQGQQRE